MPEAPQEQVPPPDGPVHEAPQRRKTIEERRDDLENNRELSPRQILTEVARLNHAASRRYDDTLDRASQFLLNWGAALGGAMARGDQTLVGVCTDGIARADSVLLNYEYPEDGVDDPEDVAKVDKETVDANVADGQRVLPTGFGPAATHARPISSGQEGEEPTF